MLFNMPTPRRALHPIAQGRQIAALGSPARQEILDGLQAQGPCSIAALAEALGRAPDSLYYHVRALERVGLVVRAGERATRRRPEVLYDVPGRMVLDHEPGSARERRALVRLVASALRIAERDLRAALDSGRAVYRRGPRRNAWGGRVKGWLTPAELARARVHLEALSTLFAHGRKRPGASLHAIAFLLTPLAPSPRARTRPRSGA